MPDLEPTGSETHESAIKKKCLCICAYGSSGSIDIQSIYLVLHVNTYEYISVYIYICVHIYCMYVCIDVCILARMHKLMCLFSHLCMCMYVYVYVYVCIYVWIMICMHNDVCMYICMCVWMYVCVSWFNLGSSANYIDTDRRHGINDGD
jgi:hypothetical protein